jgi:hypothetical protein
MPELTPSTREVARRIGLSETALRKAERAGRIVHEPNGLWDIDKTHRRLLIFPAAVTYALPRLRACAPGGC